MIALPDPDQVPRRGAARAPASCAAASSSMKDSYSFDLDDEGLASVLRARTATPTADLRPARASTTGSSSPCPGAMGGSASEEFLAPAPCRRGHLRGTARTATTRPTPRRSPSPRPRRDATGARPAAARCSTPRTPRRSRRWSPTSTSTTAVRHRRRHAEERRGQGRHARLREVETLVVGVPGDREVDLKRLEATLAPGERRQLVEAEDFARPPRPGPRLHRPAGPARPRHPLPRRPPRGRRHRLGHRRQRARQARRARRARPRLRAPTAPSRRPRSAPATPARAAAPRCPSAAASRSATSSSSAASTPTPFELDVLGPDGKPVRVTMGSYGVGVSRAVAAIAEQTPRRAGPVLAARGRPGRRARRGAPARTARSRPRWSSPRSSRRAGCACWSTTAPGVSPGVKFNDAELIGVPTILVVGRGLAEGVGSCATASPASRRRSRSTRPSTASWPPAEPDLRRLRRLRAKTPASSQERSGPPVTGGPLLRPYGPAVRIARSSARPCV